ncbi:MAG: NAD-dependent succinate-semialdehyde dehydrogenase [bacterium]
MAIQSINPTNGKLIKSFNEINLSEVHKIIENTNQAFLKWREVPIAARCKLLKSAADVLLKNKNQYAEAMTLEMGKPITQAIAEVEKCALVCNYYSKNAEKILANEVIKTDASESYVCFDPLGIILAVMPWNFPFWQVFRFAAPALAAGNVGLLKHASNVPMCALAIEDVFRQAGFPEYVFKTLLIGSSLVDEVVNHPFVKAATLTGSEPAGRSVASACGKLLKKTVMELGGSDPFIILADANLDEAVKVAVKARLLNNGQSCIAAKRFIVIQEVFNQFEKMFVTEMEKTKIGDPMNIATELGPIARKDLRIELHEQVKASISAGAKLLLGGKMIEGDGYFYPPTILSGVKKGMPAYEQEIFGPVATVIKARDEEDALRIANDTDFGLGASLWTSDIEKAKQLASRIEAGAVFINGMVKSDPRLPFGGIKTSGYGRELSHYGIKEFVNIKTVWVK